MESLSLSGAGAAGAGRVAAHFDIAEGQPWI